MRNDPLTPLDGSCAHCGRSKDEVQHRTSQTTPDHPLKSTDRPNAYRGKRSVLREAKADPFCSTECCKVYHGLLTEPQRREAQERRRKLRGEGYGGVCKGCGVPKDEQNPKCHTCYMRHKQREAAKRSRNAALPLVSSTR